jgi:multiple sugar transport system substrate-binding protein
MKYTEKILFFAAMLLFATGLFRLWSNWAKHKPKEQSITFTHCWGNDTEYETLKYLVREFESLHADIKIIIENRSYEELRQILYNPSDVFKAGDIISFDPLWVSELLKMGTVENVNSAFISFINVFYYNVDILKKAGFSRPPKTRGEFLNYARVLANREEKRADPHGLTPSLAFGLKSSRGIYDDIFPWIWSAGGQLIKDGKPVLTQRDVVESLSFLASLYKEGIITPGALSADSRKKLEDFISGKAAFIIASAREIKYLSEYLGDKTFAVSSIPIPDNYAGNTFSAYGGWALAINSKSGHKEEGRLFADFLAEKAALLSKETLPGGGTLSPLDLLNGKVWEISIAASPAPDFSGLPWTVLEESFKKELYNLFENKSSAAETALAIQKRWEAILEP